VNAIFDNKNNEEIERDTDLNEEYKKKHRVHKKDAPPLYDFKSDEEDELPPLPKWEILLFIAAAFRVFLPVFLPFILLFVVIYIILGNV